MIAAETRLDLGSSVMTLPQTARDALTLVARIALGVVLIAHGWQKVAQYGIEGTAGAFAQMGVPLPTVSAVFAAVVELVGGLALLAGAATAVAGVLVVLDMLGAFALVHVGNGVFVTDNGFELVGVIAAVALLLVAAGPGRFSVDHVLAGRRRAAVAV
jgi:putative oxidoreductase